MDAVQLKLPPEPAEWRDLLLMPPEDPRWMLKLPQEVKYGAVARYKHWNLSLGDYNYASSLCLAAGGEKGLPEGVRCQCHHGVHEEQGVNFQTPTSSISFALSCE